MGTGWMRRFHYMPLVLDLVTKELWECLQQKLPRIKKESSIVDNLEMGLDWQN